MTLTITYVVLSGTLTPSKGYAHNHHSKGVAKKQGKVMGLEVCGLRTSEIELKARKMYHAFMLRD